MSMAVTDRGGSAQELREQFDRRGYICIPGLFEADDVDAAREAVFSKLKSVGEVTGDPVAGVYSGTSSRRDGRRDLGQFWREVSEQWPLRRLTHSAALHEITGQILAGPTVAQDFVFLRASNPGRHTKAHSDTGFFTRRTDQVVTTWVCLGDTPLELGPLFVIEGSHKHATVLSRNKGFDVARDTCRCRRGRSPGTVFACTKWPSARQCLDTSGCRENGVSTPSGKALGLWRVAHHTCVIGQSRREFPRRGRRRSAR